MNIEELNRAIIGCKALDYRTEDNTSKWTMHPEMIESVRDHREFFGLTSEEDILKQLMRTRVFCKTVLPN